MENRSVLIGCLFLLSTFAVEGEEPSFPELVDIEIAGAPTLSPPMLITTIDGQPLLTEKQGLIAPALFDWDHDGLKDLLLGAFETNSGGDFPMSETGSMLRIYKNIGTATEPKFASEFIWATDTEGTHLEVPQSGGMVFTPYFYDLNDDGYEDLISGQFHPGEVTWFRGATEGFLPGKTLRQAGIPSADWTPSGGGAPKPPIEIYNYGVYSSAAMGDLDDDGDFDLVVGGSALRWSENIGGRKRPSFAQRELLLDIHGNPLVVRERTTAELESAEQFNSPSESVLADDSTSNPYVVDWDNDGVLDLFVTDSNRSPESRAITFFRGVKTSAGHRFEPGIDLLQARDGSTALPASSQRVYVDDWNADGISDLLLGLSLATMRHQGRLYVMLGSKRPQRTTGISLMSEPRLAGRSIQQLDPATAAAYPVQVSLRTQEAVKAGTEGSLFVEFDMQSNWYIYAPTGRNQRENMVETKVNLSFPNGIAPQGSIKLPIYRYKGAYDVYEGQDVVWEQPYAVGKDVGTGSYEICGRVTIQPCKEDLCLPPKTDEYCATLAVVD